jgi:hypothetical protein
LSAKLIELKWVKGGGRPSHMVENDQLPKKEYGGFFPVLKYLEKLLIQRNDAGVAKDSLINGWRVHCIFPLKFAPETSGYHHEYRIAR